MQARKWTSIATLSLCAIVAVYGTAMSQESISADEPVFRPVPGEADELNGLQAAKLLGMPNALVRAAYAEIQLDRLQPDSPSRGLLATERGVPGQSIPVRLIGRLGVDELYVERVETDGDVRSLIGYVSGDPESSFAITTQGVSTTGKIHLGPYLYVIHPHQSSALHVMKQIDKRKIPPEAYLNDANTPRGSVKSGALAKKFGALDESTLAYTKSLPENGNVRILFIYTPDVDNNNNVTTLTSNVVAEFNSTLNNSSVAGNYYVTKAGQQLVNDNFDNECRSDIIDDMIDRAGVFSNINTQMTNVDADIALLLVTTDSSSNCSTIGRIGGIARIFGIDDDGDDVAGDHPFALSTDSYALGDLTAIHEVGHVLGGYHANTTGTKYDGIPSFAEGWAIDDADPFQTVMGGYQVCSFDPSDPPQSQGCARFPYWSNLVTVNGDTIGDSDSKMALALPGTSSEAGTMGQVAAWESYSDPRPSTPSNLTASDEKCYGLHEVSWPSVSDTEQYQLLRSTSSSFANPVVIHSGTGTSTFVTVDSGTWYLRVRACNGSGCSGNSVQRSASYYPSCL